MKHIIYDEYLTFARSITFLQFPSSMQKYFHLNKSHPFSKAHFGGRKHSKEIIMTTDVYSSTFFGLSYKSTQKGMNAEFEAQS